MSSRFVLVVDSASQDEQDKISIYLQTEKSVGYWHWFRDLWLITDPTGKWSVSSIRDKVREILPNKHTIVFQVESGTNWAGFGINERFKWLLDYWNK